jgi:glutathione peroxidase-family protein
MKAIVLMTLLFAFSAQASDLYQHSLKKRNGEQESLKKYEGKTVLVTNIATRCGYTPQLDDLEKLYQKYKAKGLVIVGVPSNDFGGQTPESNEEVAKFCKLNYGVTFPVYGKSVVKGDELIDLYKLIRKKREGRDIGWNFEKVLFDAKGNYTEAFGSSAKPIGGPLEKKIAKLLDK